ncbi:PREDICTED: general odorant-binding protein 72-like [Trachymyrmex septentrionalis]|uniref:general odorant-binding protein 72-like n=1 Tax=Trachymyrmex septentrionalis TaxID=34720 RepID=UPI00084F1E59|nr:PREDICTED: general odorant-binding protein 72-like [Trachymyrmex septentrionalis]
MNKQNQRQQIRMKGTGTIFFISFVIVANLQNSEGKRMTIEEVKEALVPLHKHCIDKVGTDPKMIDDATKGIFASDWRFKCYFKCVLLNTKIMKDDKIVEKALKNIVETMLLEEYVSPTMKVMEHCLPIVQKFKGCELAYELAKCSYETGSSSVSFF